MCKLSKTRQKTTKMGTLLFLIKKCKNLRRQKMEEIFAQKSQRFQKMDKNKCPIFNTPGILETTSFQK